MCLCLVNAMEQDSRRMGRGQVYTEPVKFTYMMPKQLLQCSGEPLEEDVSLIDTGGHSCKVRGDKVITQGPEEPTLHCCLHTFLPAHLQKPNSEPLTHPPRTYTRYTLHKCSGTHVFRML